MIAGQAGFVQADGHDGRVPNRRKARLDAHVVLGFVFEFLQFRLALADQRMIVRVAQAP